MTQDARTAWRMRTDHRPGVRLALLALVAASGLGGCATLGGDPGQPLVPDKVETRTGPFAVYTNAKIPPDAPAVRCLQALENDLAGKLGFRVDDGGPPVEVYILKDREAFGHFLRFYYPELPPRRAFFLAQGAKRMVYTYANDRLEEDLRHEATHALLHVGVGDLPLWLDEGLAEYFEGPGGRDGLNPEHLARLPGDLKAGWQPDLARLETLESVRQMSPRDYRESWAWVHLLLNGPPQGKAALLAYLSDLRADPSHAAPLSGRLEPKDVGDGRTLLGHLERVRSSPAPSPSPAPVATAKAGRATILLQNSALDPAPASRAPARKGVFGRLLDLVGIGDRKGTNEN